MPRKRRSKKRARRQTQSPTGASVVQQATPQTLVYPLGPQGPMQMQPKVSDLGDRRLAEVRRLTKTVPAHAAIQKIKNGVLEMPWRIKPPLEQIQNEVSIQIASWIEESLRCTDPNDLLGNFRRFGGAIIDELLVGNRACVERQPGINEHQVFWSWIADSAKIQVNPDWKPYVSGVVPKYYELTHQGKVPIAQANMFEVVHYTNAYERIPWAPMRVAYNLIEAWLGLSDYSQRMTHDRPSDWLLDIGDVSGTDLHAFRGYWEKEVKLEKKSPIVAGKGQVKAVKYGATDDAALYPKYNEYLRRIINLAFHLSARDGNIQEADNRATAGVAADATFANAIKPLAQTLFETLEIQLVQFYYPGYRIAVTYQEPRSQEARDRLTLDTFKEGVTRRDEARESLGLDPLDGDDGMAFATSSQASPATIPGNEDSEDIHTDDPESEEPQEEDQT